MASDVDIDANNRCIHCGRLRGGYGLPPKGETSCEKDCDHYQKAQGDQKERITRILEIRFERAQEIVALSRAACGCTSCQGGYPIGEYTVSLNGDIRPDSCLASVIYPKLWDSFTLEVLKDMIE